MLPPATQRCLAGRAHSHTAEVRWAHASPVARPAAVTKAIVRAATATD